MPALLSPCAGLKLPALQIPHGHSSALLAEITPFDPEEDVSEDEAEADAEEWWVPSEAGGDAGGQESAG